MALSKELPSDCSRHRYGSSILAEPSAEFRETGLRRDLENRHGVARPLDQSVAYLEAKKVTDLGSFDDEQEKSGA